MRLYNLKTKESAEQLSPAREKLKALLDHRAAAVKRVEALRTANDRLKNKLSEAVKANADLVQFDAESTAAMLAWSKNALKKGDAPAVDTNERQALLIAKATTGENAVAANAAMAQLDADIQIEARASQSLQPEIEQTIAEIISDCTGPLIEDLRESVRAVLAKQNRLNQALQAVIGIAHAAGPLETMKPTFVLMEGLAERLRTAAAPTVETTGADRAAWEFLATRLRSDASAELEG